MAGSACISMSPSYGIERLTVSFCFQTSHGKNTANGKMAAWPKGQDGTQGQGQGVEGTQRPGNGKMERKGKGKESRARARAYMRGGAGSRWIQSAISGIAFGRARAMAKARARARQKKMPQAQKRMPQAQKRPTCQRLVAVTRATTSGAKAPETRLAKTSSLAALRSILRFCTQPKGLERQTMDHKGPQRVWTERWP